jgi:hypothetical protein
MEFKIEDWKGCTSCGELHPPEYDSCPYETDEYKNRSFYGKPIPWMSKHFHPYKIDKEEFVQHIRKSLFVWNRNMDSLINSSDKYSSLMDEKFMEQWIELFLTWFEVQQDV